MSKSRRAERRNGYQPIEVREDIAPPLGGVFEGPEFIALAKTCFNPNDGSEQGVLDFIANCNRLGMTAKQISKASWVRGDNLTPHARRQEQERHSKCGHLAEELWGPFNRNPVHPERKSYAKTR